MQDSLVLRSTLSKFLVTSYLLGSATGDAPPTDDPAPPSLVRAPTVPFLVLRLRQILLLLLVRRRQI